MTGTDFPEDYSLKDGKMFFMSYNIYYNKAWFSLEWLSANGLNE